MLKRVTAGVLDIAYLEAGDPAGPPVILLHGFPYDVRAYAQVAPLLPGYRVLMPWLRGYGATRFLSEATPRSGEQAVLGQDLRAFMDALAIPRAVLGGYDWGGRAACIVAALWPERVVGLVTAEGYNIQDIAASARPAPPEMEHRYWYQYYLHGERGRAGLAENRDEFCRLLWRLWSPDWAFSEADFAATATAFANPDFVPVVVHSYRHRFGLVPGDPAVAPVEALLARQPPITVPSIAFFGASDGVAGPGRDAAAEARFTGGLESRVLPGIGHNIPQEAPGAFAAAIRDVTAQR